MRSGVAPTVESSGKSGQERAKTSSVTAAAVDAEPHSGIFESVHVALWYQDFSRLLDRIAEMRTAGITNPRTHFESNPDELLELVKLVRVLDVNSYAVELFEAAHKNDLLGALGATFLPETAPVFLAEVEALWEGKRRFESEAPVRTLRGRQLDVLLTIHWGGDHCEQTLVSILDISKHKAAQRDAARLAAIVESSDDAIVSKNLEGIITSWNQGAEQLFGYTAAEIVGKPVTTLIPAENQSEEVEILARIRAGQRVDHYETKRRTKDGRLVDVSLTVSPIRDAEGGIIGASKIARAIGDRKRAELALARRAEEQAALFKFTDRLYRAGSRADVFEAALDAIIQGMQCDRASILLFDAAGVMRFEAWRGLSEAYRTAVDGHSPWTTDSEDPEPIHIDDLEDSDLPGPLRETIRSEGIGALSFFPLLVRGRIIGKFMAYFREPHPFTQAELDLGLIIARQLGFSLERRRADEERDLLVAELSHRVKNTLATVMSIARQTFSRHRDIDAVRASLEARIGALAQTHTRLAEGNWSGVSLETMLLDELTPYRFETGTNVQICGPRVELGAQAAVMLGMVIHELATNAAKYGSLSTKQGVVDVSWQIDPNDQGRRDLAISWIERGGPRVEPPAHSGFGRLLLERALPSSLMGSVELHFEKDGLQASLRMPLAEACPESGLREVELPRAS